LIQKFGVLGSPIAHSLSPAIHNAAFELLGRAAEYVLVDTANLEEWFAMNAHEFAGLSLTMPLKEQAFAHATWVDEVALATKSINTMVPTAQGWAAYNTDPAGISYAISKNPRFSAAGAATIIGTGATARSAAYSLQNLGLEVCVWGRNHSKAEEVAQLGRGRVLSDFEVAIDSQFLISTLPMGVLGQLLPTGFAPKGVLLDVGYRPWPTPGAQVWMQNGEAISGLEMLIGQALVAQRIFNFADPSIRFNDEPALLTAMHLAALGE
jgi:shikimate dehydrogenase